MTDKDLETPFYVILWVIVFCILFVLLVKYGWWVVVGFTFAADTLIDFLDSYINDR